MAKVATWRLFERLLNAWALTMDLRESPQGHPRQQRHRTKGEFALVDIGEEGVCGAYATDGSRPEVKIERLSAITRQRQLHGVLKGLTRRRFTTLSTPMEPRASNCISPTGPHLAPVDALKAGNGTRPRSWEPRVILVDGEDVDAAAHSGEDSNPRGSSGAR